MMRIDVAGAVASVVGLIVSVWILIIARRAKKAAEEARAVARRRNLMEELDDAEHKLQELGVFVSQKEWVGVQIRTTEILAICRSAVTRWSDHISEARRTDVLTAVQLVHSIATRSAQVSIDNKVSAADMKRLVTAHLKASGLLNDALGEARRKDERVGSSDGA